MITGKVKTVEIEGARYDLRKMTPARAAYIWQLFMRSAFKARQSNPGVQDAELAKADVPEPPVEERMRGFCAMAFMYMEYEAFTFVQVECMQVISRWESVAGVDAPMPVMKDAVTWAAADIADNPMLVTRLMIEAVIYNCSGFLAEPRTAATT